MEFAMDEIFLFFTDFLIGTLHCVARLMVEDDLIKENLKDESGAIILEKNYNR